MRFARPVESARTIVSRSHRAPFRSCSGIASVRSPMSSGPDPQLDPRVRSAWRTWLSALATDAEAAMAAALAYESLTPEGRDAWLDALELDSCDIPVPAGGLYAPLLAVESDETRRGRMTEALTAHSVRIEAQGSVRALHGVAPSGDHLCVVL